MKLNRDYKTIKIWGNVENDVDGCWQIYDNDNVRHITDIEIYNGKVVDFAQVISGTEAQPQTIDEKEEILDFMKQVRDSESITTKVCKAMEIIRKENTGYPNIKRMDALKIVNKIMHDAEIERLQTADDEANKGISYDES